VSIRRRAQEVDITVITGLSGAGRSEAAKALEDMGWYVIDNLPPALISKMMPLVVAPGNDIDRVALVIDVRGGAFFKEAAKALEKLRRDVCNFRLVFLEASDEVLVRRYDLSRRRHPMAGDGGVIADIQREREHMRYFRDGADMIIDTSEMSVRNMRTKLSAAFEGGSPSEGLKITVVSFGYKHGLPLDADLVLDVRFLPNPHWVDELRPLSGLDEPVCRFVLDQPATGEFLGRIKDLLAVLLPGYSAEGRHYLTVGVGCTGGRHRSVVLANEVATMIEQSGFLVKVIHRDVEREPVPA
jgi:RNase adapter protein RapZ